MNKFLPVVLCGLMLTVSHAQAQDRPGYKGHSHEKETTVKPKNAPRVAERDLADVILTDTLDEIWHDCDEHFHKGEWNHVINLNRLIVEAKPDQVEAYDNCAWLLWSSDRNDQGIAFLKQGIANNPKSYYLLDALGTHYSLNLKQFAEAIPYYERALQLKDPKRTYTVHSLARCYEKTNQLDKALKMWETALDMPLAFGAPKNVVAEAGVRRVKALMQKKM